MEPERNFDAKSGASRLRAGYPLLHKTPRNARRESAIMTLRMHGGSKAGAGAIAAIGFASALLRARNA